MTKNNIRKRVRVRRDALLPAEHRKKSQEISRALIALDAFQSAESIFTTLPFGSEFDTQGLIDEAWSLNKTVLVPVCLSRHRLGLVHYESDTPCHINSFGLREVNEDARRFFHSDALDFCLIPGLAFDLFGGRIGYGGGYYDRFLPSLPADCYQIAASFELQVVDMALPTEPYDAPIPRLLTEAGMRFEKL